MRQKDIKKKGLFNYKKIIIIKVIQYYNKITSYFKIFTKKKSGTVPRKQDLIIEVRQTVKENEMI